MLPLVAAELEAKTKEVKKMRGNGRRKILVSNVKFVFEDGG